MIKTEYPLTIINKLEDVSSNVLDFFHRLDADFYPPISQRTEILSYIASIIEKDGTLLLAWNADKIIGVLGMTYTHLKFRYMIQYVAVDTSYRNQQIAEMLLRKSVDLFKQRGAERVSIRTWSTNLASQKLYLRNGFVLFEKVLNDRGDGVHSYYFGRSLLTEYLHANITTIGILGGMGSFSTGVFIRTLTSINKRIQSDQDSLSFILVNAPSIPSRAESIQNKRAEELIRVVNDNIEKISNGNVSHLVILCFTLHPFINLCRVRDDVELIDLVDYTKTIAKRKREKLLLAATLGTYSLDTFAGSNLVVPSQSTQVRLQEIIHEIKTGMEPIVYKEELLSLALQNQCTGIVLGCTDLHGMFGYEKTVAGIYIIDPLIELSFMMETIRLGRSA